MGTTADVEAKLRGWLADGTLVPEARLPSERALVEELGASRTTVRLVLTKMVADGSVRSEHGRGYYVCRPPRADPELGPWRVVSTESVLEGPVLGIERQGLASPTGHESDVYIVKSPRVVATAILNGEDELLMVWRFREATGVATWELPGGHVDADEELARAAVRCTESLTGVRPNAVHHVLSVQPMPSVIDAAHEIFVGEADAVQSVSRSAPDVAVEWIPVAEISALFERGKVSGAATLITTLAVLARGSVEAQRSLKWMNLFQPASGSSR